MNTIDGFWNRVVKTETCWFWQGATQLHGGAGVLSVDGKLVLAHRYSYELSNGPIPNNLQVFQSCGKKNCVNTSHLFLDVKNSHQPLIHKKTREEDRFEPKVQKLSEANGGCWIWIGALCRGYGVFWKDGKNFRATHCSWEQYTGRPVPKGLQICHHCDTPQCVNPQHLFLGTTLDNAQDRQAKGRSAKGDTHGKSKISNAQVLAIRADVTSTHTELAKKYGVARQTISLIRRGITHRP